MSYKTGWGAVDEAIKKAQSQSGGQRAQMFGWDPKKPNGDKKVIRLLSDDVITIGMHEFIPCTDGKKRDFVCAAQLADPRPCWICDNVTFQRKQPDGTYKSVPARPREITVGLAALRVEEKAVQGKKTVLTYKDYLHDIEVANEELLNKLKDAGVEIEGQTVKNVPWIGVVKQAHGNFWSNFNAYYARYGTTTDRDYEISRQGNDRNTKYPTIPCDPDPELDEQEKVDDHYLVAQLLHPTLVEWVERRGAQAYFDAYLTGNGSRASSEVADEEPAAGDYSSEDSEAEAEGQPAVNAGTQMQSLREQLKGYRTKS